MRGLIRVLGVDPTRRGLSFAVIEGNDRLVGWGSVGAKKLRTSLVRKAARRLIDEYQPDFVVLETPESSRRGRRSRRAIMTVRFEALEYAAGVRLVSRRQVQVAFASSGPTKTEVAKTIAARFPELKPSLPKERKPWASEDERMNIFDAASFALTALPGIELSRSAV